MEDKNFSQAIKDAVIGVIKRLPEILDEEYGWDFIAMLVTFVMLYTLLTQSVEWSWVGVISLTVIYTAFVVARCLSKKV